LRVRFKYGGWVVLSIFFGFMLLHHADRFIVTPLVHVLMEEFGLTYTQTGLIASGTIVISAVLFPIWGYLFDKYSRAKLCALASAIWGATTWLSALARNFAELVFTRASTGVDNAATPGFYSLISDYYSPENRGSAIGKVGAAIPLGTILGTLIGAIIGITYGWRTAFTVTAVPGFILAVIIWFLVKDVPRGRSEPELAHLETITPYTIDRELAVRMLKRRSLLLLYVQGFFGVFPWQVVSFWIFAYVVTIRGLSEDLATVAMVIWLLAMALGHPIGGVVGDRLFRKTPRGRVLVSTIVVFLSALSIFLAFSRPFEDIVGFIILNAVTAFIMPQAAANVIATTQDITEPEGRSAALAILGVFENSGSALSPLIAGYIADSYGLHIACLSICVATWVLCGVFFAALSLRITEDVQRLRSLMDERAEKEKLKRSQ
jgi:ACS family hexuronate transporter-like MFS transporter